MTFLRPAFRFLDPGPLVDGELELVPPQPRWVEEFLAAVRHPDTVEQFPREARLTRDEVQKFLAEVPLGHCAGDVEAGRVPSYQFWMMLRHAPGRPYDPPRQRIAGALSLRVGHSQATELYYGHIGYSVYPPARGHRYALRAARLVLPLARAHGLRFIWLTCNPENAPSRRTIELLGGRYVNTIPVPPGEPLYERGEVRKSRFKLELG